MDLPLEVQRLIASFLTTNAKRIVLRGSKTYTLYITVVLSRFVWRLICR